MVCDEDLTLQRLAENIVKQFGQNCEVAIHEFRDGVLYIKHIENGQVTGRHAGEVSMDSFFDEFVEKDFIRNPVYLMKTKDGRDILASTTPITEGENTKGFICINYDITQLEGVSKALEWAVNRGEKLAAGDVNQVLEYHLASCEQLIGKTPEQMDRDDKFQAVKYLESKHVFLITKSSARVCEFLNLTKYGLYTFLDEIRNSKQ